MVKLDLFPYRDFMTAVRRRSVAGSPTEPKKTSWPFLSKSVRLESAAFARDYLWLHP